MPFELGLDHSAARFGAGALAKKSILILEETRYDYQKSLSDISGWDIEFHDGDHIKAVRKVSRWLIQHAGAAPNGPSKILREYPTIDFVHAMTEWVGLGRPL